MINILFAYLSKLETKRYLKENGLKFDKIFYSAKTISLTTNEEEKVFILDENKNLKEKK